jgi:hypothetical protein
MDDEVTVMALSFMKGLLSDKEMCINNTRMEVVSLKSVI